VCVRPITHSALRDVSRIHLASFPESALSKLGAEPVLRYYRWQLDGPHECHALGVWVGATLAGFAFGGVFRSALGGFVRQNRLYLAWRVATHPWLLTGSVFRQRMGLGWVSLRRGRKPRTVPQASAAKPGARNRSFAILALAVHPDHKRTGLGTVLLREMEILAGGFNFESMDLSVQPDNEGAVRFYERLGWKKVTRDAEWSGHMEKALPI